jgi:tetratricopeptide (TPR) repeat protein
MFAAYSSIPTAPIMNRFLAGVATLTLAATPLLGQQQKEPRRPKLEARADTNSAHAYYDFAIGLLQQDPDKAADALYWSTRLDPQWAEAFYARRVALLLGDKQRLIRYWSGDRRTIQSDDIKRIDSLFYHALTLNPFVSQMLDRHLFEGVVEEYTARYERTNSGGTAGEMRYAIDRMMMQAPAADQAWMAYGEGRFADALPLYAKAIAQDKKNGPLHLDRARVFFQLGKPDSALTELTAGIEDLRKRDKKELIYVYQSKALTEQSIGIVQLALGHADAAREAFGRALQEDLAYYPAHLQLAFLAIETKDTTTALTEMELATQLRDDDAGAHYLYGYTLEGAGKHADAEAQLRKAIALNPVYAAPLYVLGQTLESQGRKADAVAAYQDFLKRSALTDIRRDDATARLARLGAGSDANHQ